MNKFFKFTLLAILGISLLSACKKEAPDGLCTISSFVFTKALNNHLPQDISCTIDNAGQSIHFVVPEGTSCGRLIPTFTVTKFDEVYVNGHLVKSGVTPINANDASIRVIDSKSELLQTYMLRYDQNDGVAELISLHFKAADNAGLIDKDYAPEAIDQNMLIRIKGGAAGKHLVMTVTAGLNDVISVNDKTVTDGKATVDCDFPIDITVTDAIAGTSKSYVLKVGKILEHVWTRLGSLQDPTNGTTYELAVDPVKDEPYLAYLLNKQPHVSKWNGTAFASLGGPVLEEAVANIDMDVYDGVPYVLFQDTHAPVAKSSSVMSYDGGWGQVGARGFGEQMNTTNNDIIVVPGNKRPLTVWACDTRNSAAGIARRALNWSIFNGSSWDANRQIPGRTPTWYCYNPRLVRAGNDIYLLVFNQDQKHLSLYKYSGNSWNTVVGSFLPAGATTCNLYDTALAADGKGNVYICLGDDSTTSGSWFLQVYKLNGDTFEKTYSPVLSDLSKGRTMAMNIGASGTPVLAYRDAGEPNHVKILSINEDTKDWNEAIDLPDTAWSGCKLCMKAADNGSIYLSYGVQIAGDSKFYEYIVYRYALEPDNLPQ